MRRAGRRPRAEQAFGTSDGLSGGFSRHVIRPAAWLPLISRLFEAARALWPSTPSTTIPTAKVPPGIACSPTQNDLGDDVARAKSPERAGARRKYRAYLAQQEAEAAQAADSADSADSAGSAGTPAVASAARTRASDLKPLPVAPGARMGLGAAARAAYRKPHYLDDLRNIRPLVLRSNTLWPILIMCAVAGLYSTIRINSGEYAGDPILSIIFSFLFFPVPLVPPMLAGFLAPRSTWLAGALASFIATMTVVAVFAVTGAKLD